MGLLWEIFNKEMNIEDLYDSEQKKDQIINNPNSDETKNDEKEKEG